MQRIGRKFWTTVAIVAAVALGGAGIAYADDISNNLDATVDSAAEAMPLNVGGANGTTTLFVTPKNGDGKQGCNLTGGTTLGVSVSSSTPGVATVSPSSATFAGCSDSKILTVTPVAAGSTTITVAQTSNSTGGTFNLAPATFVVTVSPPPNTAPTISVVGVTGGANYNKGAVPPATCQVVDAEDGNSSFPATLSTPVGTYASDGLGSQTASCSYTDAGGLTASASATYTIVDPTPPVITSVLAPTAPDGTNGWYRSNVTLTWTVSEPESPNSLVRTGCADQFIVVDQLATTYPCSASSAGGSTTGTPVTIKRDATAPTDVAFVGGPVAGTSYFAFYLPPAPTCTATDTGSLLAGCAVTGYSTAVGTHTLTATATDNAGNVATATRSYTVRPNLTFGGFFQPVDNNGVLNLVKGGSTVPLKFTVTDEGVNQTSTGVVQSFTQAPVNCNTGAGADDVEIVTTGGTTLRYDATAGQFIQNWKTPTGAGTCHRATVTTIDGITHTALFKLK